MTMDLISKYAKLDLKLKNMEKVTNIFIIEMKNNAKYKDYICYISFF